MGPRRRQQSRASQLSFLRLASFFLERSAPCPQPVLWPLTGLPEAEAETGLSRELTSQRAAPGRKGMKEAGQPERRRRAGFRAAPRGALNGFNNSLKYCLTNNIKVMH